MKRAVADYRQHIRLLRHLPDGDYARFCAHLQRRVALPDETLMTRGENCGKVFFVLSGRVRITSLNEYGEEIPHNFCAKGATLGELNAVDGAGHSADVVTVESCDLLWMTAGDFVQCLQTMPQMTFAALLSTVGLLRATTTKVESLSNSDTDWRLVSSLLLLDANPAAHHKKGSLQITQTQLATMSGCSRSSAHRVLDALSKAGLVERTRGGLRVLDRDGLRLWCENRKNREK